MKTWILRVLILVFLVVLGPLAKWLQWTLSTSFGRGDGEISSFYINYAVPALPTLCGFLIVGLCLWWFRRQLSSKALIYSLSTIIITFGLLNFAAEIFLAKLPKPNGDDHDHRQPYPFIEFKGSFKSGKHNVLGYGGKVPEYVKKQDEYRIFFLGGSTVRFGDPSIPQLVEKFFHAQGYGEVQVFNFGVSGSNTSMELARLIFEVLEYQPDMMVSYSGGNDIHLPLVGDPRPGYPFNYMVRENNPLQMKSYPGMEMSAYGSHLLRLLGHRYFQEKFTRLTELRREVTFKSPSWREQFAEIYVSNLAISDKIARAYESSFVAFLQPSLLTKNHPTADEKALLGDFMTNTEVSMGVSAADWVLHDEEIRNQIRERLTDRQFEGMQFYDLSSAFDDTDMATYIDIAHTEQPAKPLIAKRIFDRLREIRSRNSAEDAN